MTTQELEGLVAKFRKLPPSDDMSLEQVRDGMRFFETALPAPDDARVDVIETNGVAAEWVRAPNVADDANNPGRVLLYLHGGGYTYCGPGTHRLLAYNLSAATGMPCLLPDYRLAPEHPFPAAVDDAVAAYGWLLAQGYDAGRIAIGGDSAGGGLTVATMLALKQTAQPLPGAAVCISPWTDMTMSGASIDGRAAADPMVQRSGLERCANWYLGGLGGDGGGDGDRENPLASPHFGDLTGLPPLLIQVGSNEVLLDDAARTAELAKKAGVEVNYQCWEEMFHVWQLYAPMLSEGRDAIAKIGEFLDLHVA
ncbi:MAG: alpha/beta hydrolase [Rhodospirillaceae bacterium]|nr:alpha/beta hydrolase [Rhodospirillaceae bacterium]MBT6912216.1 alpha/beta hydrolase [Rhodospirillaceae bacterium]